MSSSYPFFPSFIQQNNNNSRSSYGISNNNSTMNSMTVSGSLHTPAKPINNHMCSPGSKCSSHR